MVEVYTVFMLLTDRGEAYGLVLDGLLLIGLFMFSVEIRVPVSKGHLKQSWGCTARLPRGGEWLRNHVSIPIGSAVWSG